MYSWRYWIVMMLLVMAVVFGVLTQLTAYDPNALTASGWFNRLMGREYLQANPKRTVWVLYSQADQTIQAAQSPSGTPSDAALLAATELANLLGRFEVQVRLQPVREYKAGQARQSLRTFYLSTVFNEEVPAALKEDVLAGAPITWLGYNIWQFSHTQQQQLGLHFDGFITTPKNLFDEGLNTIEYRGYAFKKEPAPLELVRITPAPSTQVLASISNNNQEKYPYAIQNANFWYIADNPFSFTGRRDRYLVLADLLGPMLGQSQTCTPRAVFRLEDIHPNYDLASLRQMLDLLERFRVPFGVTVIPLYRNLTSGTTVQWSERPALVEQLKRAEALGGRIFQHGYTHQYENLPNPQGITAIDWEFWNITANQPVEGLSAEGAASRVETGKAILQALGLNPVGWVTPHYTMDPSYYPTINNLYPLFWEQRLYRAGPLAKSQFFPYPVKDISGAMMIPDNLDYVRVGNSLADMLETAKANRALHCPWAGFFVHPFLTSPVFAGSEKITVEQFERFLSDLKTLGYTFVDPTTIRP